MRYLLLLTTAISLSFFSTAQTNLVTYAGNSGNESFNDVAQLSDGRILVIGTADNLSWLPASVTPATLTVPTGIANDQGTGKTPFILLLDSNAATILAAYALPAGAAEDFRFLKFTNRPGQPTGAVYLSGTTEDATTGGYFIGRLNNNFVNGAPTGFSWIKNVKAVAGAYPKTYQPWDVGSDGKVTYAWGDSHDYNWSAIYRQKADGTDDVVPNWRVHWKSGGGEYYGAAAAYSGGLSGLLYSAIVFKRDPNRCELRSTNSADYNLWQPDGNGGMKKGKWPLDVLYDAPCVPGDTGNTVNGPGYTGYSPAGIFTYGPSSVCIDRRTNAMYIGFNAKSVLPDGNPDFEPAVMAMDSSGALQWWSRLYHEVTPAGDTVNSEPDQYVDALAVDYSQPAASGLLVVGARCHGNNTENFWEGTTIAANPAAYGFQNQFTGSSGNLHLSWIGKLTLANGTLMNSTYMGEQAEGATGLGTPHPDPNLGGWPDPNTGWPTLNTTYFGKNMMKVTADGSVLILGKGRRTITTANAYQKMILPGTAGQSCWNDFVRQYTPTLSKPVYSSLLVGAWDTLTQSGGDNVRLYGVWKTAKGVLAVGQHTGSGNELPLSNVPAWGSSSYSGESAVLAYLQTPLLYNPADGPDVPAGITGALKDRDLSVYPNPAHSSVTVALPEGGNYWLRLRSVTGTIVYENAAAASQTQISLETLPAGVYLLEAGCKGSVLRRKIAKW